MFFLVANSIKALRILNACFSGSKFDHQTRQLMVILIVIPLFAFCWKCYVVYKDIDFALDYSEQKD